MTLLSKPVFFIPVFMALSACSVFEPKQASSPSSNSRLCADENGNFYPCNDMLIEKQESKQHPSLFSTGLHFVQLGDYTKQIALELKNDLPINGLHGSVIVTPFVSIKGLTKGVNDLGQNVAEFLTDDLGNLGVSTSDKSLARYLNRSKQGEIEFSAQQNKQLSDLNAAYVLAGKISRISSGLKFHTKILELKSGKLVASSVKVLPNSVVNSLL